MAGLRGRGPGRGAERDEPVPADEIAAWFAARVPAGWFTGPPRVTIDRDEITVVGALVQPDPAGSAPGGSAAESAAGSDAATSGPAAAAEAAGWIRRFREETRDGRIVLAREAEQRFGRKVAWGVSFGGATELFTALSVPVMTRLRQPERQVLDTLVDSGVARSRSEALAWCVRLVGENADAWLARLREAMEKVEQIRAEGPGI
ncbi:hypothetical protein CcI49_23670 [Frankia sp. CcI49]|uniref:hypothetical protein n=1 Tax=unclassified Frankia TaxID=2632575 RepID=UPI0006CA3794|nr:MULTISPECIES: hypothetical protein [unclassified Frankia]KPM57470.1 hypothetical protein ACG83_07230 [Frankia sp. R43]ONH57941.1 hypothetical protein CcI49_23670 [Frankia sp. CcI49]